MRINSTGTAALPATTTGQTTTNQLVNAELRRLIVGDPMEATVRQVADGRAMLDVKGLALQVMTTDASLQPGNKIVVRFNEQGRGFVDLGGGKTTTVTIAGNPSAGASSTAPTAPAPTAAPPRTAAVYVPRRDTPSAVPVFTQPIVRATVLDQNADGTYRLEAEGRQFQAAAGEPLPVGQKLILRVETTPSAVRVFVPTDGAAQPRPVAVAIMREMIDPPSMASSMQQVADTAETTAEGVTPRSAAPAAEATPELTGRSTKDVRELLRSLVPAPSQPPTARQLAEFVDKGGLLYESKLARAVEAGKPETLPEIAANDLKSLILRGLSQTSPDRPEATALNDLLHAIESQQALSLLAQQSGEGVRLQVPIPDLPEWRNLDLSIQPDPPAVSEGAPSERGFDIFMHAEFSDFGDTWVDGRILGNAMRLTLYIESESGRQSAVRELESLKAELGTAGFAELAVDVRSSADLPADRRTQARAMQAGVPQRTSLLDVRA